MNVAAEATMGVTMDSAIGATVDETIEGAAATPDTATLHAVFLNTVFLK
jgi:hypothetical protein